MSNRSTRWQRWWLPGFAFMSVVVGGGYATGREIVEFFLGAGPGRGLAGLALTALVWSLVSALSFDVARLHRAYDYRSFFRILLGRGWIVFEAAYLAILLLVLCVVGAAAGEIGTSLLGLPPLAGALLLIAIISSACYLGEAAIERFFAAWGVLMLAAYALLLGATTWLFSGPIVAVIGDGATGRSWWTGGLQYSGYNLAVVPAILYCARHQRCRRDSWIAGALCGPVAILPGACLYVALLAAYPAVLEAPVPLEVLLQRLQAPWLSAVVQVVIFGTLAQTGVGVIQGFIERLAPGDGDRMPPRPLNRAFVALGLTAFASFVAGRIGLIDLVAGGYGTVAWVVIAVYAAPLGVAWWRGRAHTTAGRGASQRNHTSQPTDAGLGGGRDERI